MLLFENYKWTKGPYQFEINSGNNYKNPSCGKNVFVFNYFFNDQTLKIGQ